MKTQLVTALMILICISFANAQVNVGDKSPQFSAKDDSNNLWNSKDYIGKNIIIVYFYPAAMTGGCTKQACAFRDDRTKLNDLDAIVVGISGDEVENLKYFKEAYQLNFPLLSDNDGNIAQMFGVPQREGGSIERTIGGNDVTLTRGVTASRWTFIIDKKGNIAYKNTEVNAEQDSQKTIEVIKNL